MYAWDIITTAWLKVGDECLASAGAGCDCIPPGATPGSFDGQIVNVPCGEGGTTTTTPESCTGQCIYIWVGSHWELHQGGTTCSEACDQPCDQTLPISPGTYFGQIYSAQCPHMTAGVVLGQLQTLTSTTTTPSANCTGNVVWVGDAFGGWTVQSDTCSPDRCYPLGPPSRPSIDPDDVVTMQCGGAATGDDKGYAVYQWDGTTWNLAVDNCVGVYSPSAPGGSGDFVGQYRSVQCA